MPAADIMFCSLDGSDIRNLEQVRGDSEPVVVMGGGAQSAAAIAGDTSQPVLYVEFRLYVDFRKTVSPR